MGKYFIQNLWMCS